MSVANTSTSIDYPNKHTSKNPLSPTPPAASSRSRRAPPPPPTDPRSPRPPPRSPPTPPPLAPPPTSHVFSTPTSMRCRYRSTPSCRLKPLTSRPLTTARSGCQNAASLGAGQPSRITTSPAAAVPTILHASHALPLRQPPQRRQNHAAAHAVAATQPLRSPTQRSSPAASCPRRRSARRSPRPATPPYCAPPPSGCPSRPAASSPPSPASSPACRAAAWS